MISNRDRTKALPVSLLSRTIANNGPAGARRDRPLVLGDSRPTHRPLATDHLPHDRGGRDRTPRPGCPQGGMEPGSASCRSAGCDNRHLPTRLKFAGGEMRPAFAFFLALLMLGCAQQPRQPTEGQLALWTYWASQCRPSQTFDAQTVALALQSDPQLKGCVISHAIKANAAIQGRGQTNAIQEMGSALIQGSQRPPQTSCVSTPMPGGGWNTVCQ